MLYAWCCMHAFMVKRPCAYAIIAVLAGALEASAVYITLFANHGCTPWATDACIVGWPDHPIDVVQR